MSRLDVKIDYRAIEHNVATVAAGTHAAVMAVVKANAYGHGLERTAKAARAGGATWLGVAQPYEAIALRASGDKGRIFTWLYGPEVPAAALIARDIDVSCGSVEVLDALVAGAREAGRPARVHLAVDTGLGREGVTMADLEHLLERVIAAGDAVRVVGVWSHLAFADTPGHPTTDAQAAVFRAAAMQVASAGFTPEVHHLANSAATLTRPDLHFDMVRLGIAMYGLPPVTDQAGGDFGLRPAMAVRSHIALVKDVPAGHGVSYEHRYVTPSDTTLGLVSAGYADGVFRAAGSVAEVEVRGRRYRIAGRVCMDQFVIDLGRGTDVRVGDVVTLIGPEGPSAKEWGDWLGTIDYEIVCRFGGFLPRDFR